MSLEGIHNKKVSVHRQFIPFKSALKQMRYWLTHYGGSYRMIFRRILPYTFSIAVLVYLDFGIGF